MSAEDIAPTVTGADKRRTWENARWGNARPTILDIAE
jgi:hypothetical protein